MSEGVQAEVLTEHGVRFEASVANLGSTGLFLRTTEPLVFGQRLTIRLLGVSVRGEVLFVSEGPRGVVVGLRAASAALATIEAHRSQVEVLDPPDADDDWYEDTSATPPDERMVIEEPVEPATQEVVVAEVRRAVAEVGPEAKPARTQRPPSPPLAPVASAPAPVRSAPVAAGPVPMAPAPAPMAPAPTAMAPAPTAMVPAPTAMAPSATPMTRAATPMTRAPTPMVPIAPAPTPVARAATPMVPAATPMAHAATPMVPAATPMAPAATPMTRAPAPMAPAATPMTRAPAPMAPAATPMTRAPTPMVPMAPAPAPMTRAPAPMAPSATPMTRAPTPMVPMAPAPAPMARGPAPMAPAPARSARSRAQSVLPRPSRPTPAGSSIPQALIRGEEQTPTDPGTPAPGEPGPFEGSATPLDLSIDPELFAAAIIDDETGASLLPEPTMPRPILEGPATAADIPVLSVVEAPRSNGSTFTDRRLTLVEDEPEPAHPVEASVGPEEDAECTADFDLPRLESDGYTVRFASASAYRAQYAEHISHGGMVVAASALPIGTQRMLSLVVPDVGTYTVSARVVFHTEGRLGFMLDSFGIHRERLKAMAKAS